MQLFADLVELGLRNDQILDVQAPSIQLLVDLEGLLQHHSPQSAQPEFLEGSEELLIELAQQDRHPEQILQLHVEKLDVLEQEVSISPSDELQFLLVQAFDDELDERCLALVEFA